MPEARYNTAAAVCGDSIYLIGGTTNAAPQTRSVRVYEPATGIWSSLPDYPGPPIRSASAIGLGGYLYVFGGYLFDYEISAEVWRLDPPSGTWTQRTPMPEARLHASVQELDGRIFLLGGRTTPAWQYQNSVLIYDPSLDRSPPDAGAWSQGTPVNLPVPLGDNTGVAINGDLFTLGSYGAQAMPSRFLVYSPRGDSWQALPPSPLTTVAPAAVRARGKLYIVEGPGTTWSWEYTPDAARASHLYLVGQPTTIPLFVAEPSRPEVLYGAAVVEHDGAIYALGGVAGPISDHAWVFVP